MAGDEWKLYEVADLLQAGHLVIGDGYRAKNSELAAEGMPFARAGNINDGFKFDGSDCFPESNLKRVGNKIGRPGDVVFTSKGTVGRFAFVRPETPRFVYSPQLCFWRSCNPKVIHSRFLYYWMSSREFYLQFKGVSGQTDMAEYVSLSDQRRMNITLPPLHEQQAIACILGALDDKIELNRRRNRTLEAMARALFQSWFVDFDPVKAKSEGRKPPGLSDEIAALFPDRFADSPLGPIPAGWRVGTVADVAEFNGWTLGKRDEIEEIDYIEISEVIRGEIDKITRYARGEEPGRARRRLQHGDTAISTVRPDRGSYFLCIDPPPSLIASTGFAVLSAKAGNWAFVHVLTTRSDFGKELGRLADGGAYPAVRPEVIAARSVVIPANDAVLSVFERLAQPFLLKAEASRWTSPQKVDTFLFALTCLFVHSN